MKWLIAVGSACALGCGVPPPAELDVGYSLFPGGSKVTAFVQWTSGTCLPSSFTVTHNGETLERESLSGSGTPRPGCESGIHLTSGVTPDTVPQSDFVVLDGDAELASASFTDLFLPPQLAAENVRAGATAAISILGSGTLRSGEVSLQLVRDGVSASTTPTIGSTTAQYPIPSTWPSGPSKLVMVGMMNRTPSSCTGAGACKAMIQVRSELIVDVQP